MCFIEGDDKMFPILGLILICEIDITYARTSTLDQDCQTIYLYDFFLLAVIERIFK